jgi:Class II flagellar assembly regulator
MDDRQRIWPGQPGKNGRVFNQWLTMRGQFCPMRITERPGVAAMANAGQTQRTAGAGARFTLGDLGAPSPTGSAQAAAPAGAIGGLLAVQAAGGEIERRQRAMRRGSGILDGLDRLKIGLLSGQVSAADLLHIRSTLMQQKDQVDDPGLQDLLAQIDLRAEVELAKLARR